MSPSFDRAAFQPSTRASWRASAPARPTRRCRRKFAVSKRASPCHWSRCASIDLRSMRPRPRSLVRSLARLLAAIVGVPLALLLAYALAAFAFALFPTSGRPQQMKGGEPVLYVCASLAHTDILL